MKYYFFPLSLVFSGIWFILNLFFRLKGYNSMGIFATSLIFPLLWYIESAYLLDKSYHRRHELLKIAKWLNDRTEKREEHENRKKTGR